MAKKEILPTLGRLLPVSRINVKVTEIILFLPVLSILFFLIEWQIQFQIERIQFPRKGGRLLLALLPADFLGLLSFLKAYSNRKD